MKTKIMWIIVLLTIIITAAAVQFMPDEIPAHYNIYGDIDRWGSKYESFIIPAMTAVIVLIYQFVMAVFKKHSENPQSEKKQKEARTNMKVMNITGIVMTLVFAFMQIWFICSAFLTVKNGTEKIPVNFSTMSVILIGISFIILGNVLPKTKMNGLVGVRMKWSMLNDRTWAASNRFGGIVFIISGIIIVIGSCFLNEVGAGVLLLVSVIIDTAACTVYSYKIYCDELQKINNKL